MKKNVQISFELFQMLLCHFSLNEDMYDEQIQKELEEKLEKLIAQEYFARYKKATEPSEREFFRQQYLDTIGMKKAFRSETETPYSEI